MKQKGLAPILIVLLIALVVGGYLIYQKQTKPVPQPSAQPSSSPVTTSASGSAETANWKTYTGKGYEFRYLPNGHVVTDDSSGVYISYEDGTKPYFTFRVAITDNLSHLTTKQVVDKMVSDLRNNKNVPGAESQADQTLQTMKEYTNGQITGIKLQSFDEGYPQKFGKVIEAIENKIYTFSIGNGSGGGVSDNDERLLDQILSTFKFIN